MTLTSATKAWAGPSQNQEQQLVAYGDKSRLWLNRDKIVTSSAFQRADGAALLAALAGRGVAALAGMTIVEAV
jgi:hypothetical protein